MLTEISLDQFNGTENYYQHENFKYTDGIKYLAKEANCYWLLDVIGSYQNYKLRQYSFQLWELKVNDDKSALITMKEDTCSCMVVKQEIDYTDFPLKKIKLYFINGILLLPSEY